MSLQLLFSLLGLFGSKIYAETEKKLPVVFLCADLTALLSLSLWFIVFVEGELQSALNSTFYASGTCTHGKKEQLSTRPIISYRMLKMVFSVSLLKYMFDVAQAFVIFQERSVPTFVSLLLVAKQ